MIPLGGRLVDVPGVRSASWHDDPKRFPRAPKGYKRGAPPDLVVVHTVHGVRGDLVPGVGPAGRALRYARYQATTTRAVSWDYTLDTDGFLVAHNDPAARATWHAGAVNRRSVGIELVQEADGDLYQVQMAALVALCDALAAHFGIPRAIPVDAAGAPLRGVLARVGAGFVGHRNLTRARGAGDPGDHVWAALAAAGYARAAWAR